MNIITLTHDAQHTRTIFNNSAKHISKQIKFTMQN